LPQFIDDRMLASCAGEEKRVLLKDKVVMVTGGGSPNGMGKATARLFSEQGARLAIVDIQEALATEAASDIGADHHGYACDVSDHAACIALAAQVQQDFGRIDGLINFAGISRSTRFLEVTPREVQEVFDINLRGTMNICQAVVPLMPGSGGSIVCIGSMAGQRGGGVFGGVHYSASKSGVHGMAKAMARELAPLKIRVNAIAPGLIQTDIFAGKLTDIDKTQIVATIPLGRIGLVEDVAHACLFLMSDWSSFVTGIVLDVNGGQHIH
jgi:NAD(P)-dependent dehydrogenase (short-subunit alcohol dehydrogenase family)